MVTKTMALVFLLAGLSFAGLAQYLPPESKRVQRMCLTVGILQGGGSVPGADLERLLTQRFGVQAGAGFMGFGAGLNYHFKPWIRSSFVSLQYWHQGIGDFFLYDIAGTTYVYRSRRWLTFQLGMGVPFRAGPLLYEYFDEPPPVALMYSIGAYLPFGKRKDHPESFP